MSFYINGYTRVIRNRNLVPLNEIMRDDFSGNFLNDATRDWLGSNRLLESRRRNVPDNGFFQDVRPVFIIFHSGMHKYGQVGTNNFIFHIFSVISFTFFFLLLLPLNIKSQILRNNKAIAIVGH